MKKLLLALSALVSTFSPAFAKATAPPARPALWKVSDADTIIYLFGTIHALPEGVQWQGPAIRAAETDARELMLEIALNGDPNAIATTLFAMGKAEGLPPILDRVKPAKRAEFQALIARSGLPAAMLDSMKTWAAATMLVGVTMKDIGISGSNGVEEQLSATFRTDKKPISGLETIEQQLGFLDHVPESAQRAFLDSVVDNPADSRREFNAMLRAWERGDITRIMRTFDTELKSAPELRDALVYQRNRIWAAKLEKRMAEPGSVMVAVGAGHLAGPGSVVDLLKAKGLKVERVQ